MGLLSVSVFALCFGAKQIIPAAAPGEAGSAPHCGRSTLAQMWESCCCVCGYFGKKEQAGHRNRKCFQLNKEIMYEVLGFGSQW